nr:hypothetical protein [Tanacetum cinerariifolium]
MHQTSNDHYSYSRGWSSGGGRGRGWCSGDFYGRRRGRGDCGRGRNNKNSWQCKQSQSRDYVGSWVKKKKSCEDDQALSDVTNTFADLHILEVPKLTQKCSPENAIIPVNRPDKGCKLASRTLNLVNHFPVTEKLSHDQPDQFPLLETAYDGGKNIFSVVRLPEEIYKLKDYLSGGLLQVPPDLLQGMDIVMKENLYYDKLVIGNGFYPLLPRPVIGNGDDLYCGAAAFTGFQQSLKPTSSGLFYKEVNDVLKGLKVTVTHRHTKQKYVISVLTDEITRNIAFEIIIESMILMLFVVESSQAVKVMGKNSFALKRAIGKNGLVRNFKFGVNKNMKEVSGRVMAPPFIKLDTLNGNSQFMSVDKHKCQWNLLGGKTVVDANDQYLANICLKINAKLGGSNVELVNRFNCFTNEERFMLIGADAKEQIENFGKMCFDLVKPYEEINHMRPNKIIVFRDGVSDCQMVLNNELVDLKREICNEHYKPLITLVVAQKRHMTRFFFKNDNELGNVSPGTVVDRGVIHPLEYDFYLNSHFGGLGTSKPTHYSVYGTRT